MEIKVQLNNLRVAPRKSREVIDLIRGKNVVQAKSLLEFTVKRSAESVLKLLNSAVAAAEHNHQLKDSDLYVAEIRVDGGPILKRMNPESRGRGFPIMKRTSHITLILKELNPAQGKSKKEVKKDLPAQAGEVVKTEKVTKPKRTITKKVKNKRM